MEQQEDKAYVLSTISTVINDKKVYVSKTYRHRSGNRVVANHTSNRDEAKTFNHRRQAADYITKIVNPCDRVYEVDTIVIKPDHSNQLASADTASG